MSKIPQVDTIKQWVSKTYSPGKGSWTSERSHGNYNDCFDDGFAAGESLAAYHIGILLGMDLEKPHEPDED
jgi:hypothetical protein